MGCGCGDSKKESNKEAKEVATKTWQDSNLYKAIKHGKMQ